jgi:hypothetical protein
LVTAATPGTVVTVVLAGTVEVTINEAGIRAKQNQRKAAS